MNDKEFVAWVDDHVRTDKKLPACRRMGDTVELFEKNSDVDMTLRIEEVPESVVIISPEDAKKWSYLMGTSQRTG